MPYRLNVNGRSTKADVPGDMALLLVIRGVRNLKGTKFGCSVRPTGFGKSTLPPTLDVIRKAISDATGKRTRALLLAKASYGWA